MDDVDCQKEKWVEISRHFRNLRVLQAGRCIAEREPCDFCFGLNQRFKRCPTFLRLLKPSDCLCLDLSNALARDVDALGDVVKSARWGIVETITFGKYLQLFRLQGFEHRLNSNARRQRNIRYPLGQPDW